MGEPERIGLGVTLYSFTQDFKSRRYTFEELIRKVGALDLGPGIEIVGFQSLRGFPDIAPDVARRFRRLVDAAGLQPRLLSGNVDVARRRNRLMTDDEIVEYVDAQLNAAVALGFPILRLQFGAHAGLVPRLLPLAEKAGVKIGPEIHAPHSVDHPSILAYREVYEKLQSPYLGFVPDFGASTRQIPPAMLEAERAQGTSEEVIRMVVEAWNRAASGASDSFAERRTLVPKVSEMTRGEGVGFAWRALTLFGHQKPEQWAEIAHQVLHVHAKFYGFDERGDEPSIDYPTALGALRDNGYAGGLSSEWEGHAFSADRDGFEMVKAHRALLQRILADA